MNDGYCDGRDSRNERGCRDGRDKRDGREILYRYDYTLFRCSLCSLCVSKKNILSAQPQFLGRRLQMLSRGKKATDG